VSALGDARQKVRGASILGAHQKPNETAGTVDWKRGDEVMMKPMNWLWKYYLPRGKLIVIAGAKADGKTTIGLKLAATVTRGGEWPDGTRAPVGSALIWSGEDDISDTLAPRLVACGADLSRVYFVVGARDEQDNKRAFDPARDIPILAERAAEINDLVFVMIDPLVSAVSGDSHKNAEVRRALQPLAALAEERQCVVVGITHFTKGTSGKHPVERVTGSLAFGAASRVILVTATPKDNEDQQENGEDHGDKRMLIRAASNVGPSGGGFEYDLIREDLPDCGLSEVQKLVWGNPVEGKAWELLNSAEGIEGREKKTKMELAREFLVRVLSDGPMNSDEVKALAAKEDISARTLVRAKEDFLPPARQQPGSPNIWLWWLPGKDDGPAY
jgi:putative DNA primase/helicase